jgi:acyl-CoA thioesterase-1
MNSRKNLFLFGDSICFGQGVSLHNGWVANLSREIERLNLNRYTVTNAGVNGNTTRLALERMPYDIQSHGIDTILLQFGLNDCNYWISDNGLPRVSPKAFQANLIEIISRSRAAGAATVILNTNHPTIMNPILINDITYSYTDNAEKYNGIIREVAKSEAVTLIDIEECFMNLIRSGTNLQMLLLDDGLHLSELGHKEYFKEIWPVISANLANEQSEG